MNQRSVARIVVTTDGSEAGTRGVSYAAAEAAQRHASLQIVHVMPSYVPSGPFPLIPDDAFAETGRSIVEHAHDAARKAAPELDVASSVLVGGRVSTIVEETADADLLVLGGRDASATERVWTGSTVTGVAARASCPVLVIPPASAQNVASAPHGRVVAALKVPQHGGAVLRAAFAEAARTGAHVMVVHAWSLAPMYDDVVAHRADRQDWSDRVGKEIEEQLAPVRDAFPTVESQVVLVHGQPAHLLLELSRASDRLVISRPAHGGFLHHLGATARAVLRDASCPVEVVPPEAPEHAHAS